MVLNRILNITETKTYSALGQMKFLTSKIKKERILLIFQFPYVHKFCYGEN